MQPRIVRARLTNIVGVLVGLAVLTGLAPGARSTPLAALIIYDDALNTGWQDWSWDTTVDLNNSTPAHGGSRSIAATYTAAWAGLYLHADPAVDLAGYDTLRFYLHGGSAGGQRLRVVANGSDGQTFAVTAPANTWTQIDVPLAALGNPATLSALYWQDTTGGPQATFHLDDIQLINAGLPIPTPVPPGVGPALSVNAQADAISQQFTIGAEYAARSPSRLNAAGAGLFVADLYNAFLKRPVDLDGFRFWTGQIASGAMTRSQVRAIFVGSPEFQARANAVVAQGCIPPLGVGPPVCTITANGNANTVWLNRTSSR